MERIKPRMHEEWVKLLSAEFGKEYFAQLKQFLGEERKQFRIFPPGPQIFSAFDRCPPEKVKVVIIGQDPYHGPGQANGLCFSVANGIRQPPSLVNIFKELKSDLDIPLPRSGNLESWAAQGVLLLNATLTVRENTAGSHQKKGWETFTDAVIKSLSDQKEGLVFMLWGNYAMKKGEVIDRTRHLVLTAPHPSPLARGGFAGCRHFSKANEYLLSKGKEPVDWKIE
jgi:uracil-DNA glycosylase